MEFHHEPFEEDFPNLMFLQERAEAELWNDEKNIVLQLIQQASQSYKSLIGFPVIKSLFSKNIFGVNSP